MANRSPRTRLTRNEFERNPDNDRFWAAGGPGYAEFAKIFEENGSVEPTPEEVCRIIGFRIKNAVSVAGTVYMPGMEPSLAEAMSQAQRDYLESQDAIEIYPSDA